MKVRQCLRKIDLAIDRALRIKRYSENSKLSVYVKEGRRFVSFDGLLWSRRLILWMRKDKVDIESVRVATYIGLVIGAEGKVRVRFSQKQDVAGVLLCRRIGNPEIRLMDDNLLNFSNLRTLLHELIHLAQCSCLTFDGFAQAHQEARDPFERQAKRSDELAKKLFPELYAKYRKTIESLIIKTR